MTNDQYLLTTDYGLPTRHRMLQLIGHQGTVHALTFTPDGQSLVSAGKDETIRVWDVVARRERTQLLGHIGDVYSLAVHGDGRALASGGRDCSFRIWDLQSGKLHEEFPKQMASVTGLAWLPQQSTLAMTCGERFLSDRGGELRLWHFKPPMTQVDNVHVTGHGFWSLAAAAGPTITYSDGARNVSIWRMTGQQPHSFRQTHASLRVALTQDGRRAAASVERTVRIFDCTRNREHATLEGHKGMVTSLAFSPDGRILATGARDGIVRFWSLAGSEPAALQSFTWPTAAVSALAFSPDGLLAAAAGESGAIVVWDVDG